MIGNHLLCHIMKRTGLYGEIKTSTGEIAKSTGLSQQTVSRKLIELEREGIIRRKPSPRGMIISFDDKGLRFLLAYYRFFKSIFEKKLELIGTYRNGLGEGAYYVAEYSEKIRDKLGYAPYRGTFNIETNEVTARQFLAPIKPIYIPGFRNESRSFGGITIYKVLVQNRYRGAVVMPERRRHDQDILELVSDRHLSECLRADEGTIVKLKWLK
ncbi:MAG: DUF120 domain-containing protein [archaeon]